MLRGTEGAVQQESGDAEQVFRMGRRLCRKKVEGRSEYMQIRELTRNGTARHLTERSRESFYTAIHLPSFMTIDLLAGFYDNTTFLPSFMTIRK